MRHSNRTKKMIRVKKLAPRVHRSSPEICGAEAGAKEVVKLLKSRASLASYHACGHNQPTTTTTTVGALTNVQASSSSLQIAFSIKASIVLQSEYIRGSYNWHIHRQGRV